MARLLLDDSKCTGLGICESYAEDYFEVQADGGLLLLVQEVPEADLDIVRQACESCPTEALRLED